MDTEELAKYKSHIERSAKAMTTRYPSIEDDVAQVMRISVWKHPGKDRAGMKRAMFCDAIDFLRWYTGDSRNKLNPVMVSYEWLVDTGFPYATPPSATECIDADYADRLLAGLSESQRQVLIDYFWEGKTLKEIAEERGVTESRVCQIKTECLALLRTCAERE